MRSSSADNVNEHAMEGDGDEEVNAGPIPGEEHEEAEVPEEPAYTSTPLLRRSVAGALESDSDESSHEVLRTLIREGRSRDDAYAAVLCFCRRDMRIGSTVLARALPLLRQLVPRYVPSKRMLCCIELLCADARTLCGRAHARDPHASSGASWLDKQALVLKATCNCFRKRLSASPSELQREREENYFPSRQRLRQQQQYQQQEQNAKSGEQAAVHTAPPNIWPPSSPAFPPAQSVPMTPDSNDTCGEQELSDEEGDTDNAPDAESGLVDRSARETGAEATFPSSNLSATNPVSSSLDIPNRGLSLPMSQMSPSDVEMTIDGSVSASGPSSYGNVTTTTTTSSSSGHGMKETASWMEGEDLKPSSNGNSGRFLDAASNRHGDQHVPTIDELVYLMRERWRGEEPTNAELESARSRRERSRMQTLSERARREGPARNIQDVTLCEQSMPALIGAALRGADGWGVDSPATCALASQLVTRIADSLNYAASSAEETYALAHMLMHFLDQEQEAVRARAYDLLTSAVIRTPADESKECARFILFLICKRTLRQREPSEKVWLALRNCLMLICSSNGEVDMELLDKMDPAVLCELCSLSGKLGWPVHVQAHLSLMVASRASRCAKGGINGSNLFDAAGGASRLLRSCICMQDSHAYSMLVSLAAKALAEDGCLHTSSRLFNLLCKQPLYVNVPLLLLGCPQAMESFERFHGVSRKEIQGVIRRVSELHGLRAGQMVELENALNDGQQCRWSIQWLIRALACSESACERVVHNGFLAVNGGAEGSVLNLVLADALARKDGCDSSTRASRICDLCMTSLRSLRATNAYWFATAAVLALLQVACDSTTLAASLLRQQSSDTCRSKEEDDNSIGDRTVDAAGVKLDVLKLLSATICKGKEGVLIGRTPESAWQAMSILKQQARQVDEAQSE